MLPRVIALHFLFFFSIPCDLVKSAHLAVMDALMAVGAMETVTAVKTCSSAELLGKAASWEDALLHWVNEVRNRPKKTMSFSEKHQIFFQKMFLVQHLYEH